VFGNAYLSIPNVFSLTGYVGGYVLFSVVGSLNIYTMIQNLDLAERYPLTHSYSEIGEKIAGKCGKVIVDISIWLMQLSCCCSYLYFIAELMDKVICHYTGYCGKHEMYIMLLTIPALPVSWIETYTFLSYFVMVGISIAFVGLGSIMGYCSSELRHHEGCDPSLPVDQGTCDIVVFDWQEVLGHIGFAMFVFEGNAAVVNVRAECKKPEDYPKVLTAAVVTMIVIFNIMSTIAYFTYVGQTNSILALNFVITPFTTFIIVCVCINALCSYPVQILCAFDILE